MNSNTRKIALPVLAACLVGIMVFATTASAVHSRPKAGTPFLIPMVMAYKQCGVAAPAGAGAPNTSHLGGLPFPSCEEHNFTTNNAATGGQSSPNITVGSPTSTLAPAPANSVNHVLLCVPNTATAKCGAFHTGVTYPGPGGSPPNGVNPPFTGTGYDNPSPDNDDVEIEAVLFDVRCINGIATLPCSAAGSNGAQSTRDYTGEMQGTATIRITDENNVAGPGGSTHATVVDLPFTVDGSCAEFAGTNAAGQQQGGTCLSDTSANAAVPGAAVAGKFGNVEIGQVVINDGGPDRLNASADNSPFMRQGIFIP